MIETVVVRPIEHTIVVRPFIDNQAQGSSSHRVVVRQGVHVVQVGVQGPPGRNGLMSDFEQTFADCIECIVNHNLGRYPIPLILSAGGEVMDAQVINTSVNQFRIYFNSPTSGRVRCI